MEEKQKELDRLVERLKYYMAENNLSIGDVAKLLNRPYPTVRAFLLRKTNPQIRMVYAVKKLLNGAK